HGFRGGDSRHASSDLEPALLRGPEGAGQALQPGILAASGAEVSRLFRGSAAGESRVLRVRPQRELRRPEPVSDRRGASLRVSETDETFREAGPTGRRAT